MSDTLDPYRKWLGIPPKDQPPNHYRLLAIELFEDDPDVIEAAADQRMAHVRTYQTGRNSALSQQLLNELSAAKLCLLDKAKKSAYDEELRREPAARQAAASAPPDQTGDQMASRLFDQLDAGLPSNAPSVFSAPRSSTRTNRRHTWPLPASLTGGAIALLVIIATVWIALSRHRADNNADAVSPTIAKVETPAATTNTRPVESRAPEAVPATLAPPATSSPNAVAPNTSSHESDEPMANLPEAALQQPEAITNSVGMRLQLLPAGEMEMGLTAEQAEALKQPLEVQQSPAHLGAVDAALPRHPVKLTKPFYVGVHEVTVGQFRQFVAATSYKTTVEASAAGGWGFDAAGNFARKPEHTWQHNGLGDGDDLPVINVSWDDAVAFCRWLSELERVEYRLPTEAEWEYAARSGGSGIWSFGDDPAQLAAHAWFVGNHDGRRHPVGQKQANRWGLYDMYGNVSEFCSDRYAADYYASSPVENPSGPSQGEAHAYRGGCYGDYAALCTSAVRLANSEWLHSLGFRVVRAAEPLSATERIAAPPQQPTPKKASSPKKALTAMPQGSAKQPVPDAKSQSQAEQSLRERYKNEWLGGRNAIAKLQAARALLAAAKADEISPAERYVLLSHAADLAAAAGAYAEATSILGSLAEQFDAPLLAMKADALVQINRVQKQPAQKLIVIEDAMALIEEAIPANDYETAERTVKLAALASKAVADRKTAEAIKQAGKDVTSLARAYEQIRPAAEKLRQAPDDAEANFLVGRFECEAKRDWSSGLSLLAKGSDESLRDLAQSDLKQPTDAKDRKHLADLWLKCADQADEAARASYQARALYWLQLASPGFRGTEREELDKAIGQIEHASVYRARPLRWLESLSVGFQHDDEIDCSVAARSFDLGKRFDLAKSWTLELEFQPTPVSAPEQILFVGDDRGGRDPLYVSLVEQGKLFVTVCDSVTNEGASLQASLGPDIVSGWRHLRVTYRAQGRHVSVELDGREVADQVLGFSPKIDVPMPVWVGGVNATAQRYRGKVRRIVLRNTSP